MRTKDIIYIVYLCQWQFLTVRRVFLTPYIFKNKGHWVIDCEEPRRSKYWTFLCKTHEEENFFRTPVSFERRKSTRVTKVSSQRVDGKFCFFLKGHKSRATLEGTKLIPRGLHFAVIKEQLQWGSLTVFKHGASSLTMTLNTFSPKTVMQDLFVPAVSFFFEQPTTSMTKSFTETDECR